MVSSVKIWYNSLNMRAKKECVQVQTLGMRGTKWNIFVTAVYLFASKGCANVSIRDIAKATNIKAASIYNHFESKDALIEHIYNFCEQHFNNIISNLDNLVELVPTTPPQEIFKKYFSYFGDEIYGLGLYELMPKIMKIVLEEAGHDKRAEKLAIKLYYTYPKVYLRPVIEKMMELDLIEPIDMDLFIALYNCLELRGSYAHGSKLALSGNNWRKCRTLLFSLIRAKK